MRQSSGVNTYQCYYNYDHDNDSSEHKMLPVSTQFTTIYAYWVPHHTCLYIKRQTAIR